jgi:hypothetical protein
MCVLWFLLVLTLFACYSYFVLERRCRVWGSGSLKLMMCLCLSFSFFFEWWDMLVLLSFSVVCNVVCLLSVNVVVVYGIKYGIFKLKKLSFVYFVYIYSKYIFSAVHDCLLGLFVSSPLYSVYFRMCVICVVRMWIRFCYILLHVSVH